MIVTDNVTEIALMMKSIFAEVFPKRMFNLDFKIWSEYSIQDTKVKKLESEVFQECTAKSNETIE